VRRDVTIAGRPDGGPVTEKPSEGGNGRGKRGPFKVQGTLGQVENVSWKEGETKRYPPRGGDSMKMRAVTKRTTRWALVLGVCVLLGCTDFARLYPVKGPLSTQTPVPIYVVRMTGKTINKQTISVVQAMERRAQDDGKW